MDTTASLTFDHSRILGRLDLSGVHIGRSLALRSGTFNEIGLDGAKVDVDVDLGQDTLADDRKQPPTRVHGKLNMGSIHIGHDLKLENAALSDVDLSGSAKIDGDLNGTALRVASGLNMDSLEVDHHVNLATAALANLFMQGAAIAGNIHLESCRITGEIDMDNLQAKRHVLFDGSTISTLHASSAQVAANFSINQVNASGRVALESITIGGYFFARGASLDELDLTSANVGGDVDLFPYVDDKQLTRTRVQGQLTMNRVRVGQDVVVEGAQLGSVEMIDALVSGNVLADSANLGDKPATEISGQFTMDGAKISRRVSFNSAKLHQLSLESVITGTDITLDGADVAGEIIMERLTVGGSLFFRRGRNLRDSRIDPPVVPARFTFSTVTGTADFSDTEFEAIDLTMSKIGQILRLGKSGEDGKSAWSPGAFVNLRNVSTQSFEDTCTDAGLRCLSWWPETLMLSGFSYAYPGSGIETNGEDMSLRQADWWIEWLRRQSNYSPQPYEQVATNLRAIGRPDVAGAVQYVGRVDELREDWKSFLEKLSNFHFVAALESLFHAIWLALLWASIGFGIGYRILTHTLFWVVFWVALGVWVLRHYQENNRNGLPDYPIAYSFDMLLPVIKLREAHYDIDLKSNARIYFYYHKIMGYVLASFLIAGLSGLTGK